MPNEAALWDLLADVSNADFVSRVRHTAFFEPDLDDQLTAVAIEPAGARLVAHLPLALQGPLALREEVNNV